MNDRGETQCLGTLKNEEMIIQDTVQLGKTVAGSHDIKP